MKTRFLALFMMVCLCPVFVNAQIVSHYGVKAAFTRSTLDIEEFVDFSDWRSGLNLAVYAEHDICDFLALDLQLEYTQKGYIMEQVETDEMGMRIQDVSANTRLDYLSIPLLVKIKYPHEKATPFIAFGPRFDYLINTAKGEFEFTNNTMTDDFADYLKDSAIGASISGGVQIPTARKCDVILEFRYNLDFTDSADAPLEYEVKNKSWDIWLGIAF
jgi:hypothetical protein